MYIWPAVIMAAHPAVEGKGMTMAISSADPLLSCAQAFVATNVNDRGSRAGAAMLAPAGFTCP